MALRVIIHLANEEPFVADLEELPPPEATNIYIKNPRTRDNKPVSWASERLRGVIFPMWRIIFIEEVVSQADEIEVERFYKDRTQR